ncbi:uncharacterized protein LOC127711484 [Mytilus californianus]|uniref:uncharacterized protein LOC127711484 n=1 Tax=Mytilus californianus TaxID=6549 RepID=UPI0022477042|nr:uncharacterized protein LOC127711484 [Mytilus californianus]
METVSFPCFPCFNGGGSKTKNDAFAFCLECSEHRCKKCKEIHSKFPQLKYHSIIPCSNISSFPQEVINRTHKCESHSTEKAEYYCSFHCNAFCFVCLMELHRHCSFKKLSDVSKGVKLSTSFKEMQNQLAVKGESMKHLLNNKAENLNDILRQKTKLETELSSYVSRINSYMNELIKNVKTVYEKELQKLRKDLEQLRIQEKGLCKQRDNLDNIAKFCSDNVTFLYINEIEHVFRQEKETRNTVTETTRTDLAINGIEEIKAFLRNVEKIKIEPVMQHIPVNTITLSPAAQHTIPLEAMKSMTGDILTLNKHIDIAKKGVKEPVIIDCTIFKSGQIIAIEQKHTCLLEFTTSGMLRRNVKISSQALGIAAIDENVFVLTESGMDTVHIYNKQSMSSIREVSIRDNCSGIARYSNSNFVVGCNAGGLMLIGTSGDKEKMFHTKELLHLNQKIFLTANEKSQVFCSLPNKDTILSIDYRGNVRFSFQSEKLKSPRGLTGDGNSNIYVSGYETNNILWISNDGKKSKEVLNSKNGIQSPTGIDYDKVLEILAVCNCNGSQMSIYSMK